MFSSNRKKNLDLVASSKRFGRNNESKCDDDSMGSSSSSSSSSDHEETQLSFQSTDRKPAKKIRKIRVGDQVATGSKTSTSISESVPRKPGRNPKRKMITTTTTTTTMKDPPRKLLDNAKTQHQHRPQVADTSTEYDVDDVDDDDMNDSDMEVPYTQNLGIIDDSVLALELSEKKNEPLRPGDVILYNNPVFVAGSRESIRVTQVLSTDPDLGMPLDLANGEFLPADTYVRRIKEYKYGALIDHPGISRPIENFRFGKRALSKKDESDLSGFQKQVERLRDIVLNTREELKTFPQDMDTNTNNDSDKSSGDRSSTDSDASKTPPPKRITVARKFVPAGELSSDSEMSDAPPTKRKTPAKKTPPPKRKKSAKNFDPAGDSSSSDSEMSVAPLSKRKIPVKKTPLPKRKTPAKKFIPAGESSSSESEVSVALLSKRKTPAKKALAVNETLWDSSEASETLQRKRKALANNALPPDSSDSDPDISSLPLNPLPVNVLPPRNNKPGTPRSLADKSNFGLDTDSDDSSIGQPLKRIQHCKNGVTEGALSMQDFLAVSDGNNPQKALGVPQGLSLSKRNGQERPQQDMNVPSPPSAASTYHATPAPTAQSIPSLPLQNHVKKASPPTQRPAPASTARSSPSLPLQKHDKIAPPPTYSSASHSRGVSFSKQNNRGNPIAEPTSDWMSSPQRPHSSSSMLRKYGRMSLSSSQKDAAPSTNKSSGWTCADRRPPPSTPTPQSKNRPEVTGSKSHADMSSPDSDSLFDDPFAPSHSVDLTASSDSDCHSPRKPRAQKHRRDDTRKIRTTGLKTAPLSSSRPKGGRSENLGMKSRIDPSSPAAAANDNIDLTSSPESDGGFPASSRPQQKHRTSNARKEQSKRSQGMLSKKASASTTSSKNKSSKATSKAASGRTAQRCSVFQPGQLESNADQDYACADSSEDENRHVNHNGPAAGSSSTRLDKEDRGYSSIGSTSFPSSQSSQEVVGGKKAANKKKKTPKGQGRHGVLGSSSARTSTGSMQLSFQEIPRPSFCID